MNDFLEIILAQGGRNWIDFLIPVVIGAIFVLRVLARAWSNKQDKTQQEIDRSSPGDRSGPKRYRALEGKRPPQEPGPVQRRAQHLPYARPGQQPAQQRQPQQRQQVAPSTRRIVPEEQVEQPVFRQPEPKPQRPTSLIERMMEQVEMAAAEKIKEMTPQPMPKSPVARPKKVKRKPASQAIRKYKKTVQKAEALPIGEKGQFASLSYLSDKENLRKAIIYSEILGKPLALREM